MSADRSIYAIAETLKRATRNQDIIAVCDEVLTRSAAVPHVASRGEGGVAMTASGAVCPVCAARRKVKADAQKKWRGKARPA